MKLRRTSRAAVSLGVAALSLFAFTGTAQATADMPYVGYGYPNLPAAVRCAQDFSNLFGGYWPPIIVDGKYGPDTNWAIKQFQSHMVRTGQYNLTVDGVVGKATGSAMLQLAWQAGIRDARYGQCYAALPNTL
ncbi:peptidoglycan-binding domain-containing protein [Kitasatospora sp. CM 4170]|uniref:Peptidoglycan-binding domain-containing protein n=1 Tax=Kitasatospora aburaviensis TaxID=67265 RepID=A0ABW1ESG6_9ACTN|nr:peptidoglycan-binding domain-containing protein [Kitasatospora sp. CM 4170]WNM44855.1 peptidoglycan-binding domain-containing protein [Kitasatospora sp. CM 4170]